MPDSPDLSQRLLAQLSFPCGDVPEPGDIKNVAPGIYWLRMPLPFQLNHINLWMIEEARARAYKAVDLIDWPEGFCRRDIAWRAVARRS